MTHHHTWDEVATGIYQVQLPLPFALDHVNCYLIQDEEGWTVIDAGLNIPPIQKTWQTTLTQLNIHPTDIQQIILTHAHPDHYGLAGWLQKWSHKGSNSETPVFMSATERAFAQRVWQESGWEDSALGFFKQCALSSRMTLESMATLSGMRSRTQPYPTSIKILSLENELRIGSRHFQLIQAPGHSDGQLMLYDPADQLLLCGDHILMEITPNIGLWPENNPDPLGDYLDSIRRLKSLEVRLALPGHGPLITTWTPRLAEIEQHHAERLEQVLAAVGQGATVSQVSDHIFEQEKLSKYEILFATAETLAHLEYLVLRNQLQRAEGKVWFYIPCSQKQ